MPRTVTIHAITNDLVGDETYEAWLRHEDDAWLLVDADDVDQVAGSQDFVFPGLIDGATYALQIRMKRAGRYRIGYLSADPETWPAQSRIDFTVGSLIDVGAPTLTAVDDWVRTDVDSSHFTVHITPNDIAQDLELIRDGVVVHVFGAPLANPIVYDDPDPPLGVDHAYKARHVAGTLGGPFSATITKFAGPPEPTDFVQTNPPGSWARYELSWTGTGMVRLQDDFRCPDIYEEIALTAGGEHEEFKEFTFLPDPERPTRHAFFHVRIRNEVTAFGTTDVSDWVSKVVDVEIYVDNTIFASCT